MQQRGWLLLIDLDKTLWDCDDISATQPPFKLLNRYQLLDSSGRVIRVREYMVHFIEWAKSQEATVVVLSWNIPELALEALKTLGLVNLFDYFAIEFHPRKDLLFLSLARKLMEHGLHHLLKCVVYIDDSKHHLEQVSSVTDSCCLLPGVDFTDLESLIKAVSNCLIRCGVIVQHQCRGEQRGSIVPGNSGSNLEHESRDNSQVC
ncbi:MAG: magnesium-dependent phosphatase-1 [Desulfurococcaceae archaeon]|jgi:magnesium-dependent phosphatase-1